MKLFFQTAVTVLALALGLAGCNKGTDSAVLAKVNRTTITVADFKKQVQDLDPQIQPVVTTEGDPSSEVLAGEIRKILDRECKLGGGGARVVRIRVWESDTCCAEQVYEYQ